MSEVISPISIVTKLLGHNNHEQHFLKQVDSNRIPHAFLITGETGIGKCTLALRMARFLLDGNEFTNDMFGDISLDFEYDDILMHRLSTGAHADFKFLHFGMPSLKSPYDPMNVISVDYIRSAINMLRQTPAEAKARVLIIDDAHTMNANAANALLKTLEEPNKNTYIFLVSSKANSLLRTIHSRCSTIALKPLTNDVLKEALQVKYPHLETAEMNAYITLSNGSIGKAISYIDSEALGLYSTMIDALKLSSDAVYTLANAVSTKKNEKVYKLLKNLFENFTGRMIFADASKNPMVEVISGEIDAFNKIVQKKPRLLLLDWVTTTIKTLNETSAPRYLDVKTVVLTSFLPLHDGV